MRIKDRNHSGNSASLSVLSLLIVILIILPACVSSKKKLDDARMAGIYHSAGVEDFSNRRFAEAKKNFEKALELDGKNVYYLNDLALSYAESGDLDSAIRYFNEALKINPELSEVRNGKASVMALQGNLPEAIIEWEKVLQDPLYKSPGIVHYNLGTAYFRINDMGNAELNFQNAIKYYPAHVRSLYYLGRIYQDVGRLDEASSYYKQAIKSEDSFVPSHFYYGEVLFTEGSYEKAMEEFETVINYDLDTELSKMSKEYIERIKKSPR